MGITVKMVPPDWKHPKQHREYIDLEDGAELAMQLAHWDLGKEKWDAGFEIIYEGGQERWQPKSKQWIGKPYTDFGGERPDPKDFTPNWPVEQRTHFQLYENAGSSRPISPVLATKEELADYAKKKIGESDETYHYWLYLINKSLANGLHPELYFSGKLGGEINGNPYKTPGIPYRLSMADLRSLHQFPLFDDDKKSLRENRIAAVGLTKLVNTLNRFAEEVQYTDHLIYADALRYLAEQTIAYAKKNLAGKKTGYESSIDELTFKTEVMPLALAEHPDPRIACIPDDLRDIATNAFTIATLEQKTAFAVRGPSK